MGIPADVAEYRQIVLGDSKTWEEEWVKCQDNFRHWARIWAWIVDKKSHRVLFELNATQDAYRADETQYDIILKARKLGFSTYKVLQGAHDIFFHADQNALLIAHRDDLAVELMNKLYLIYNLMPEFMRPSQKRTRRPELELDAFPEVCPSADKACQSRFSVLSAEGKEPGVGRDLTRVHLSEYAKFGDPESIMAGVVNARRDEAPCTIEATANGMNAFYDAYVAAKRGETAYRAFFFSWTQDPSCVRKPRDPQQWNPHVKAVVNRLGLTAEQGQFYQERLASMHSNIDKLKQEWPVDDVECFLTSGRPFFNPTLMGELMDTAQRVPPLRVDAA